MNILYHIVVGIVISSIVLTFLHELGDYCRFASRKPQPERAIENILTGLSLFIAGTIIVGIIVLILGLILHSFYKVFA